MKTMLKKFNLSAADVTIRPIGGSQPERYNAMMAGIIQAAPVTPPLDARGKKDGLNVIYNLKDLNLPFIYSSVHTNPKTLKERPQLVQRFVAAMAESVYYRGEESGQGESLAQQSAQDLRIGNSSVGLRRLRGIPGQPLDDRAGRRARGGHRSRPGYRHQCAQKTGGAFRQ